MIRAPIDFTMAGGEAKVNRQCPDSYKNKIMIGREVRHCGDVDNMRNAHDSNYVKSVESMLLGVKVSERVGANDEGIGSFRPNPWNALPQELAARYF